MSPSTQKKPDLIESRIAYLQTEMRFENARHQRRVDKLNHEIVVLEMRRLEGLAALLEGGA